MQKIAGMKGKTGQTVNQPCGIKAILYGMNAVTYGMNAIPCGINSYPVRKTAVPCGIKIIPHETVLKTDRNGIYAGIL
jgi:hypothetical protein